MLQRNTYSLFRKPKLSSIHALSFISLVALILFISTTNVYSAQVTVEWNPNTEADIAGYQISSGPSSGNYDNFNAVVTQTSDTIQNLEEGQTYYIAARAIDTSNNKSDYSAEVVYTVPNNQPPVLNTIANIFTSEGATVTLNPTATDPDGDPLTFSYSGWMTTASYTTDYNDAGVHTVTVTVSDGFVPVSQDVKITVINSNQAQVYH